MAMAAVIATVVFILLGVFQIIVALGAPYGQYVWGGQHKVLPKGLRVGSVIAVGIYAGFAICLLSKAGVWQVIPQGTVLDTLVWIISVYLVTGIFLNAISRSKPERFVMTPVTAVLAACAFVIALA